MVVVSQSYAFSCSVLESWIRLWYITAHPQIHNAGETIKKCAKRFSFLLCFMLLWILSLNLLLQSWLLVGSSCTSEAELFYSSCDAHVAPCALTEFGELLFERGVYTGPPSSAWGSSDIAGSSFKSKPSNKSTTNVILVHKYDFH